MKAEPDAFQISYNLGVLLEGMDRPEEAIAAYESASRSEEEMGDFALFKAAGLYHKTEDPDAARQALEAFLKRNAKQRRAAENLMDELEGGK